MLKKTLLACALIAPLSANADIYTIDPAHSFVHFSIDHMGFSKLTGRFNAMSGTMDLDFDKGTGTVDVRVDPASVDTAHQKRDNHLRSADFFNVVEFPDITFKSTSATLSDNGGTLKGDLTIKGITQPVTLVISNHACGIQPFNKKTICGFNATTNIKRSDFNINWGLPNIVGDEVALSIEAEGIKEE
ncbi:YceI family protein [Motiliproteus sp. SC1-56]|uniref:YceI family protein n=1 Tax=Motiliproteus sp. SC1-56 TaxID=2799565 RepID=UPI001A8DDF7D|nr:YceI family protein [Motiliproteus sp. SC1-56]